MFYGAGGRPSRIMPHLSRRALLSGVAGSVTLLAGCSQGTEKGNLIRSTDIPEVRKTEEGLSLKVQLSAKYSCNGTVGAISGALIDVFVLIDDERVHSDTWKLPIAGCMHESTTTRWYNLDVSEYDTLAVTTEVNQLFPESNDE